MEYTSAGGQDEEESEEVDGVRSVAAVGWWETSRKIVERRVKARAKAEMKAKHTSRAAARR